MQVAIHTPVRKARVVIILNRLVIGGPAVDTIPLASHLLPHFDILLLYGEKEKDEMEATFLLKQYPDLQLKKIVHLKRSVHPFRDLLAFFRILQIIHSFKPDIVHTHGAKSGFLGRIAAAMARVPVIIHTFHGHFFHSYFSKAGSRLTTMVETWLGKITTSAIALSNVQKNELVEHYKILPAAKVKTIHLGFEVDSNKDFVALRARFRNKYGLKERDVAVGIVGRIVAVKNHQLFVNVIEQLMKAPTHHPVAFFIVGDGDLRKQVEKNLQQKNISFNDHSINKDNRVVFTSWITEMDEVMSGLDVIALSSLNEGTPLSIIEAQYFKKPVVCTNVGGVKDTVLDGKSGFLVNRNDPNAFTDRLRLLIDGQHLRQEMGEEGFQFVSTKFSKQGEIDATEDFYHFLLHQKGRSLL